jgi:hypothetical protein
MLIVSHAQLKKSATHAILDTQLLLWVQLHYVKLAGFYFQTVRFVHRQQHVMLAITHTD